MLISAPLTTHAFDVASTVLPSLWAKLGFAVTIQLVSLFLSFWGLLVGLRSSRISTVHDLLCAVTEESE